MVAHISAPRQLTTIRELVPHSSDKHGCHRKSKCALCVSGVGWVTAVLVICLEEDKKLHLIEALGVL